ncbi:hypothetical protein [Leptolyngbya sp. FACHB-17]|uniref:hypothetical protein n=1 Tax=unclassified Leptolyngbya TaxID=2650499 RepID=UPI0016805B88|nr:hypothetical protein [Leptolyngbya sp. FACHB-17]MBD2078947.1 hypothetical protein [Leptolyngbya sp. FACHB-17]
MAAKDEKTMQQEAHSSEVEKEPKTAKQSANSEVDNAPDIESLTEILHGDPTEIESEEAIDSIDEWVDFLKGHKEENIKELSASLKELKKLLKGKKTEASQIVEVLAKLGEQTNAIGDEAGRGVKGPMHTLGKALITFSHKIERAAAKAEKEA